MKNKFYKKVVGALIVFALALCGLSGFNSSRTVFADNVTDTINYVSLGDSIAEGYGLSDFIMGNKYGTNQFVTGCYTDSFKKHLETTSGAIVNSSSFARSGITSLDLVSLIDDTEINNAISQADVITICIGGNDLLGPSKTKLLDILITDVKYTFGMSEVAGNMDDLDTVMTDAVNNFETNLQSLIAKLEVNAPNAKVIFTSIYNPYKELIGCNHDIAVQLKGAPVPYTLTKSTIQQFGIKTEDYLAGSKGKGIVGLNQKIQNVISGKENFYYVDSKAAFDNYSSSYMDITCATLTSQNSISVDVTLNLGNMSAMIEPLKEALEPYIDPHPTAQGHTILFNTHKNYFEKNFAYVTYNFNGGATSNGMIESRLIAQKGKMLENVQEAPYLDDEHYFAYWSKDTAGENEYNWDDNVTDNLNLYACFKIITFTITFNYNGGFVNESAVGYEEVNINQCATQPTEEATPKRDKYLFAGWFEDLTSDVEFDFSTPITENKTLFAKWELNVFNVTFYFNEGNLNGDKQTVVEVTKNNIVADIPSPEYLDHEIVGWYKDSGLTEEWDLQNDIVTEDTELYAKWRRNIMYVTLDFNGKAQNGSATYGPIKVKEGDPVNTALLIKPTTQGYLFIYWYLNNEETQFDFTTPIWEDITLYAYWKESITITIHDGENTHPGIEVIKGITIEGVAKDENVKAIIESKQGRAIFGWYDASGNELLNNYVLLGNRTYRIKWITLKCTNEELLKQPFSPITQSVPWHIDARNGSELEWCVNGEVETTAVVYGDKGATYNYIPTGAGEFTITCKVDGVVVNGAVVSIIYSIPHDIQIILNKVTGKRTYHLQVDNNQYYQEDKFVWYKTADGYSDQFTEEIGRGFECVYKFNSDCKVVAKYLEFADSPDGLVSNEIEIKVDRYLDDTMLYGILGAIAVVGLIVAVTIFARRKFNKSVR